MDLEEFKKKYKTDIPPRAFLKPLIYKKISKDAMEFLKNQMQISTIPEEDCVMIKNLEQVLDDISKSHKIIVNGKEYYFKSYKNIDDYTIELNLEEATN